MELIGFKKKSCLVIFSGVLLVSGCASTGQGAGGGSQSSGMSGCSPGSYVGAVIGGALLGALIGGNKGAAIGAATGVAAAGVYCLAINSRTDQTRTAQEVEQNYRTVNNGALPAQPTVQTYRSQINSPSNGVIKKGSTVQMASYAEVVNGREQRANTIEEVTTLYYGGEKFGEPSSKSMSASGSGGFSSTSSFQIPQKFQDGAYVIVTQLYVNGQPVANSTRQQKLQVVTINGQMNLALLDTPSSWMQ